MPIRRLGLLVSAPIGATEPPNQPSCYPTPILLRGIDHLRDLAPPPPTIDAGPDAPPLRSNWRRRQNIRRIGGAGTAARRPVGWRREGRARGRSTEAGEGRFRGKTTMAVHRPRNNWNGATPKTRAPPDGVSTVPRPPGHGEEGSTIGCRRRRWEGGPSRIFHKRRFYH